MVRGTLLVHLFGYTTAVSVGVAPFGLRPVPALTSRPMRMMEAASADFNIATAVSAAGFAFEAYNEPSENDARWERGADGIDVAFLSEEFAREVYDGILEVRLCEARDLTKQEELAQALMSGGQRDPYVIFAMNEESADGPKEGAIGLGRAVDQVRSSTVWSETLLEKASAGLSNPLDFLKGGDRPDEGSVAWPEDEVLYLYVKDPRRAQLALTVFDEEVLIGDIPLGATSVHMADLINPGGPPSARTWSGWVPLTWRPAETQDNTMMIGTIAGAAVAGPLGAAAGAALGSMIKKPVQGEIRLELKYTPLSARVDAGTDVASPLALAAAEDVAAAERAARGMTAAEAAEAEAAEAYAAAEAALRKGDERTARRFLAARQAAFAKQEAAEAAGGQQSLPQPVAVTEETKEAPAWTATLSGAAPKGGSEGIDWGELAKRVGTVGKVENEGYELCFFLTHQSSSSEVVVWRKRSERLLVVAFRGTSDVLDVLTDVNLIQTPYEQGFNGQKSDDPRQVHSGFFASACAINRRLKELLVAATTGTPGEWDLLITGHSLGGALATLMAPDLVGKVDVSRGFKARADASLWGKAQELFATAKEEVLGEMPKLAKVELYTFGAPRVGNSEFAAFFDASFGPAAFRVVNDRDVVPRLPRDGRAAGLVLDYEHVGRTVLIAESSAAADGINGFWIEGTSDDATCPLRDVSPLSSPFSQGKLLGDVSSQAVQAGKQMSEGWDKINAAAKLRSRSQLRDAFSEATAGLAKTRESFTERVQQVGNNPLEAVSMFGLDAEFVQSELRLAESLANGKAIEHHLEPSYYLAMTTAIDAALDESAS